MSTDDTITDDTLQALREELAISALVSDPDSDDADKLADALADTLLDIGDADDWRQVISWAYDPQTAVKPADPRCERVRGLILLVESDAAEGEARIGVVRRALASFRCETVDPDNGWIGPDSVDAPQLASALGIGVAEAQRRLDRVDWQGMNNLRFWG